MLWRLMLVLALLVSPPCVPKFVTHSHLHSSFRRSHEAQCSLQNGIVATILRNYSKRAKRTPYLDRYGPILEIIVHSYSFTRYTLLHMWRLPNVAGARAWRGGPFSIFTQLAGQLPPYIFISVRDTYCLSAMRYCSGLSRTHLHTLTV